MKFDKVLVANRGEIARRVLRTCRAMGYATVAVYSDADADARHVHEADEAVRIGPPPSAESYLRIEAILDAARRTGAGAIHPGYGFLSENAAFAEACEAAGVVFIGPTAAAIRAMGSKIEAKHLMASHGVPVVPGYQGEDQTTARLTSEALAIGFPLLLKASAGGGGKGMRVVRAEDELDGAIAAARREAMAAFGDDRLLIERYVERPRHIEFQILGDAHGHVVHVHERECSIQRRHQKIVEETPSVALDPELRAEMARAAVTAGQALGYRSAGTVEFILAPDRRFYFLEVNTRLQVEHPVTELVTGLDLVRLQLLVAQGQPLPVTQADIQPSGHAIECRIYAEDPDNAFLPATGRLRDWHFPPLEGLRLDGGVEAGDEVSIYYDPMLAKVVTWAPTRAEATRRMVRALETASIQGVRTNRAFLVALLRHPAWEAGQTDTHFIDTHFPPEARGVPADPERDRLACVAATVALAEQAEGARALLPSLTAGWRNSRWRDPEQRWRVGEAEREVRYRAEGGGRYRVTVDDEASLPVRVVASDGPTLRLAIGDHVSAYRVVRDGAQVWVHGVRGSTALVALDRFPEEVGEAAAGSCLAPMPGKVTQVLVEPGQEVAQGQPLVLLEAMKMEHTLRAPRAGVVAAVLAEPGQLVEADAALVRLDEA